MHGQSTANRTIVSFLLDRTGWMSSIKARDNRRCECLLDTLEREAGDVVEFTMLQYDNLETETLYLGAKLAEVKRLTPEQYEPRACVTLIDACITMIRATEETVLRPRDRPRVVVVFMAGGEDECSQQTADELRDLVERRKAEGIPDARHRLQPLSRRAELRHRRGINSFIRGVVGLNGQHDGHRRDRCHFRTRPYAPG
jgi:hypothetical protein